MSQRFRFPRVIRRISVPVLLIACIFALAFLSAAQTTISTGSIQGTVTDQSGAVVNGAKVVIKNKATGQTVSTTSSSSGVYSSGALLSGDYTVRVESKGFQTTELPVVVQVGTTSNGNVRLSLGQESQVIEVSASEVRVNTEQATVQGVITAQQIDQLPINGRNFLDAARTGATSIRPRTDSPLSPSVGERVALPELKSMGVISRMRRWERPHKTFHRMLFKSSKSVSRLLISQLS